MSIARFSPLWGLRLVATIQPLLEAAGFESLVEFQSPMGIKARYNCHGQPAESEAACVSVPYGDCVRLQPLHLWQTGRRLADRVSVPYGDCVRLQHIRLNSPPPAPTMFQSLTGIVFGCNSTSSSTSTNSGSFSPLRGLTLIATGDQVEVGYSDSAFQSPTGIKVGCNPSLALRCSLMRNEDRCFSPLRGLCSVATMVR